MDFFVALQEQICFGIHKLLRETCFEGRILLYSL